MKLTELERTKSLLSQALNGSPNSDHPVIQEVRGHIRQAISKLDKAIKTGTVKKQRSQGQFEQWWGHIQSGTAHLAAGNMSPEAQQWSLKKLNSLIAQEEQKLADLEKASDKSDGELLTD